MPTFIELQDDAALLSFEHQLHLAETVGEHAWETDLAAPRFSFTGHHPLTCTKVHLLGSAAPGPKSWLWSWANPFGYRQDSLELAEQVRDFGQQHDIPELSTAEVPFDALPGSPTDPAQVASLMMEAAKAVIRPLDRLPGPVGGGTRAGFVHRAPRVRRCRRRLARA